MIPNNKLLLDICNVSIEAGKEILNFYNNEIEVTLREEKFSSEIIGWSDENEYYYFEGRPIRTNQKIHPYLPKLKITFYYK